METRIPEYASNAILSQGQGWGGGFSNTPVGQGFGQVIGSYFTNPAAPYRAAREAYSPYIDKSVETQNPFYNAGVAAIPRYQNWTNTMSNPSDFINRLMNQYQQSPWAKFQTQQAMRGLTNQASASGLVGSTPLSQFQEQYAHDISSEDMQRWLQNVLGINSSYGSNLEHQYDTGLNAGTNISNIYNRAGESMGNLALGQRAAEEQNKGNRISGLLKMFLG
jgi:hypothetical protein